MPPGKAEQRSGVLEIAHHEWRELRMQVGRNAYFEMCSFAVVFTLEDLPDFVQTRHHRGRLVGHCQFQKLAFWSQGGAQFSQQFVKTGASLRGNKHGVWILLLEFSD